MNEIVKYENRAPQKLKTRKSIQKERFSNNLEWSKIFNQVRENDLIYLSNKRLEKKEEKFNFAAMKPYNLFQFCNPELGGALGVVNKRMKKSGNVIEVKFSYDIKDPLTSLCKRMQDDNQDFFVYYITNLSTVIREYLALKSIEFSKFVNAILDPLKYKEILSKRMTLRELNNKKYNDSQNEALRYVASMNTGGLSLIQGPPGTGKTHTIHGILNMFVETRVEPNFKILVCTPSNAACDELVSRLGRETERRQGLVYKMVRIGAFDYEPPMIVKKYTLDEMVKRELKKTGRKIDFTDIDKKCKEMDILGVEMDKIEKNIKKSTEEEKVDLKQKHEQIKIKRGKLMGETNLLRQQKSQSKINASSIEESIVRHADFIFTTLSMSGVELLDKMDFKFSHLIIDEASQATEISALIPFCHDVNKVILVGDQNQLPATVFSENAEKTLFNRSLYERFLSNEIECFTLNIQYRMQSIIREFPNNQFYDGKIVDDPSINKRILDRTKEKCPKLAFFNLEFTE